MAKKRNNRKTKVKAGTKQGRVGPGNARVGSAFDDFLEAEGLRAEVTALALKRVIAWQVAEEMRNQVITKQAMARRMATSRSALDRLLDPETAALSIKTLDKAAQALGKKVVFELVDR